jgi:hypothetical protein
MSLMNSRTDANLQLADRPPILGVERAMNGNGRRNRVSRPGESSVDRVADRLEYDPGAILDCALNELVVACEGGTGIGPVLLEHPRAAFDVAEEERDDAGRQLSAGVRDRSTR